MEIIEEHRKWVKDIMERLALNPINGNAVKLYNIHTRLKIKTVSLGSSSGRGKSSIVNALLQESTN